MSERRRPGGFDQPNANGRELTKGAWGEIPWFFRVEVDHPEINLCTAAFCICIHDRQLVLVKQKDRNWELPGGHVDLGEVPKQAAIREVREEGGIIISNPQFFGYKEVRPPQPVAYPDGSGYYPFPISYVPYFWAEVDELFGVPSTSDVVETTVVGWQEAQKLLAEGHNHDQIIRYVIEELGVTIQE